MSEISLAEWRDFLQTIPEAHILQTGAWGELKSAFGWQALRLRAGDLGAQILFRHLPLGLSFGYIPKGPVGRFSTASWRGLMEEIDGACHERGAIFLKIESDAWEDGLGAGPAGQPPPELESMGLQPSDHSIQPRRTIVVDLRGTEEAILGRMKSKCRYNIGLARRRGVIVEPWEDPSGFHEMMTLTGKRDGFSVHSLAYVKRAYELFRTPGSAELLVAKHDGRALAALMIFVHGRRAWYLYGASNEEDRELMPNYLLQWEAMRWARSCGCEEYDLWGVPDGDETKLEAGFESRSDGLWGVYRFKRGFGGQVRRAAQSRDRVYARLPYQIYRLIAVRRSVA